MLRTSSGKPGSALLKLVGVAGGLAAMVMTPAVLIGAVPISSLLYIPYAVYCWPVDPKGKADYYLAQSLDEN